MADTKIIYVYKNWDAAIQEKIGTLYVESGKGKEVISFEYDDFWLENVNTSLIFDPDLMLYKGRQYALLDKTMFGIFADSCPDRWGRTLMKRREAIIAKKEARKPKRLTDVDYLLGVYDETRMGGLRFSVSEGGPFLSDDKELATPPWTTLRKLESASCFVIAEDHMNLLRRYFRPCQQGRNLKRSPSCSHPHPSHASGGRESHKTRFYFCFIINLQIGFPIEENFSSYSVMTFPTIISSL